MRRTGFPVLYPRFLRALFGMDDLALQGKLTPSFKKNSHLEPPIQRIREHTAKTSLLLVRSD
jgi:hypothetical protein